MRPIKKRDKNTISHSVKRIHRVLQLYAKIMATHGYIDIDEFCDEYQVTERTLRRDVRVIKDLYPNLLIYFNRNWQ